MVEYEAMNEHDELHYRNSWCSISALLILSFMTTVLVFLYWNTAYNHTQQYPPHSHSYNIPESWRRRAHLYAKSINDSVEISHDFRLVKDKNSRISHINTQSDITNRADQRTQNEREDNSVDKFRLVCYYETPDQSEPFNELRLIDVKPNLCTHIHIGQAEVHNASLLLSSNLVRVLREELPVLRIQNPTLKFLLWVGGGGDIAYEFPSMVKNHATRKIFIQSLKSVLNQYLLDGVDLDWEFPTAYNRERQHFSQLLYEISTEYKRERKDYLLSVAVAAPDGIALFAYDIREINKYADYVNLMTYDYHFYTRETPFTGLNAPLYARGNERSILATLNINYSVNWWLTNGLDRNKLVVGLPTYGHSFTLVNPTNKAIGAPAASIGSCGNKGFTTYSDVCWFRSHNPVISMFYDPESCSPYLSSGKEWISFENEMSIEIKARFVKSNQLGGVMVFSLNTDDFKNYCSSTLGYDKTNSTFPLIETVKRVLL